MHIDRPILIAIILLATFLMCFFWVSPTYKNLLSLQQDLANKVAQYQAQFSYYNEISNAYHDMQSRQDELQSIDDALPSGPNTGQLIYYFQKRVSDSGLVLKSFSLSQSSATSGLKDVSFALSMSGDYASLGNLLSALQSSARIFEVTSISFSSPQTSVAVKPGQKQTQNQFQTPGIFNFNVEVRTHSY